MRNKRTMLGRVAAVAVSVITMVTMLQTPASAATGGGCHNTGDGWLGACISWHPDFGGRLKPDFYVNWNVGCRIVKMYVVFWTGHIDGPWTYTVSSGHYGPVNVNVDSLPDISQSAYTSLDYFDCGTNYLGSVNSPTVYYFS